MKSKISDVAKLANVSKSTISNYLNGRYENMSEDTRKKIEEAVRELNYTPNITARRLSSKIRCNVICLVIPLNIADTFETAYYPVVLSSVGKVSEQAGYNILIYARGGGNYREMIYLKGMANSMADGFILFNLQENVYDFLEFEKEKIPYVCVGKYAGFDKYNYVASDHGKAIRDIVNYLRSIGHQRIGIVLESDGGVVAAVRKNAFESSMKSNGLLVREEYISYIVPPNVQKREDHSEIYYRLLSQAQAPTALIVTASEIFEIERIAKQCGKCIPKDLSIVALDYKAGYYHLSGIDYTRVDSMAGDVAVKAFQKLIHHIDHREEEFYSEILPLQLTIGNSTVSPT